MKRSRFSEEQIIAILKEYEAGMPTADSIHVVAASLGSLVEILDFGSDELWSDVRKIARRVGALLQRA